jgi:hypothetical protein
MDGFNVNLGEVRAHSSTVATLSSQVSAAGQTAQASVHDNAYGVIGQFFAAAVMLAGDQVREGIVKAAKSFMDVQAGLTAVADRYQQVDQAHAELLKLTKEVAK